MNVQSKPLACPRCESRGVLQYGLEPVSKVDPSNGTFAAVQCSTHKAFRSGNLCPNCRAYTLSFTGPTAFFD